MGLFTGGHLRGQVHQVVLNSFSLFCVFLDLAASYVGRGKDQFQVQGDIQRVVESLGYFGGSGMQSLESKIINLNILLASLPRC